MTVRAADEEEPLTAFGVAGALAAPLLRGARGVQPDREQSRREQAGEQRYDDREPA